MQILKKIIITIFFVLIFFSLVVVVLFISQNIHKNEVKQPADIIVVLGGGTGGRIKKGWELYTDNYSSSGKFIITGNPITDNERIISKNDQLKYLEKHKEIQYEAVSSQKTKNTWEEILYIKSYMQKHGYLRVIIVTDPLHVARVLITIDHIGHFKEVGLEYTVISYKKIDFVESFLKSREFRAYALLEIVKYFAYEVKALVYNITLRIKKKE